MIRMHWRWVCPFLVGAWAFGGVGFLVLAPDRGFLGNEEVREVFSAFEEKVPHVALAFVTRERTKENLGLSWTAFGRSAKTRKRKP